MEPQRKVPDFRLPSSTGQTLSLDSYLGKVPMVLVFLSGLESEQDRRVLASFDDRLRDFGSARSQVMAVVKETARSVREYADENGVKMPILADASGSMFRDYEADDDDGDPRRVIVLVSEEGELVRRFDPVPLDGDVERVLGDVRGLGSGVVTTEDD